jgi:hypothetical protein
VRLPAWHRRHAGVKLRPLLRNSSRRRDGMSLRSWVKTAWCPKRQPWCDIL